MAQSQSLNAIDPCDTIPLVEFQRCRVSSERPILAVTGVSRPSAAEGLLTIIAKLLDDAGAALERDQSTARTCIARAAALVHAERDRDHRAPAHARCALTAWQMNRLTAFIEANLGGDISIEDLTGLVRMSTGHFFRSFKRSFGEPPFSFIARRRMLRAQEMMLSTDEPLCQIALACGLCDQSHFTRVFRRVIGESPNAWRRRVTAARC